MLAIAGAIVLAVLFIVFLPALFRMVVSLAAVVFYALIALGIYFALDLKFDLPRNFFIPFLVLSAAVILYIRYEQRE